MQKIVIDTNVLVSGLLTPGFSSKILYEHVLNKQVKLCLSTAVLEEYLNVLFREKFRKYKSFVTNAEIVLAKIAELAVMYEPHIKIDILPDKDDNKFLELAVEAGAHYLISGNKKDFLISEYEGVKIVSPRDYWDQYHSGSPSIVSEPLPKYGRSRKTRKQNT